MCLGSRALCGAPCPAAVEALGWFPHADAHTCVPTNYSVRVSDGFAVAQTESCVFHGLLKSSAAARGALAPARAAGLLSGWRRRSPSWG